MAIRLVPALEFNMDRSVQTGIMILGCAVLVIAAIVLPVMILRPAEPGPAPIIELPSRQKAIVEAPRPIDTDSDFDRDGLSRSQRFRLVQQEALKELGPEGDLSAALARVFTFPHERNDAIFGIDVSHHNSGLCECQIDWRRVANQKVDFVYVKATEGTRSRDSKFIDHWRALEKVPKIHRGAYHFLSADDDPVEQAHFFLKRMGPLQANDLPPALDLEWDVYPRGRKWAPRMRNDHWSNLESNEIIERALKWLDVVEKQTGRVPIVYTSRTWWVERIKDESVVERFKRYPIWISAMESHDLQLEQPGAKGRWAGKWNWTLWQFTVMGDLSTAGIPNPRNPAAERLDVNIFPGTLAQFQKVMGIPVPIEVAQKVVTDASIVKPNVGTPGDASTPSITQKDPPKESQAAAVAPSDSGTTKPNESSAANNPGGSTVVPAESPKDPPKETQVVVVAPSDSATKPNESSAANNPGGSTVVPAESPKDPPKETQAIVVAPSDTSANKPEESGAANTPAAAGNTVTPVAPIIPPKEIQVVAVPSSESGTNKPNEAGKNDGEPKARPSPASAHSPKTMIEIVLLNGRIIRVDASIDPAVLSRFVALLEAP
jgi:lysozyme